MLKQHLDRFVVGQDKSKRVLSTAIYHHYHRIQQMQQRQLEKEREFIEVEKEREREFVRQMANPTKEGMVRSWRGHALG